MSSADDQLEEKKRDVEKWEKKVEKHSEKLKQATDERDAKGQESNEFEERIASLRRDQADAKGQTKAYSQSYLDYVIGPLIEATP